MHPGQGQSYSADEQSEVQPMHVVVPGFPGFIAYGGRLMARVAGGENVGGAPAAGADAGAGEGEGQGGGLGLYDLTTVPEHLRPVVEPLLKKVEGNVTQRFQEHADFRKQWEPFQEVEGLTELQPDALKELVEFHRDVLSNADAFKDWWTQLGTEAGWMPDASAGDDGQGDEFGDEVPPAVSQLQEAVESLSAQVQSLVDGHQQTEQTQRTEAAKQAINTELEQLAGEELGEGQKFDDETRDAILTFALRYPQDADAIKKGYADLQKLSGKSQVELVKDKLEQPSGGTTPAGPPDTSPGQVTSFAEAKRLARERRTAAVG